MGASSGTGKVEAAVEVGGRSCISSIEEAGVDDVHGGLSKISSGSVVSGTGNGAR